MLRLLKPKSELNDRESLPKRVLNDLVRKDEIAVTDLSTNALNLHREYTAAESIGAEHVSLDDTDIIVVLSGRSGFKGTYLEKADKYTLCPNEFDASDTARRMSYGINIAKKCTKDNLLMGIKKSIYIYFNGVKGQNDELRKILDQQRSYDGYPANLFVIDPIPLDNTLGQVIGLSKYLHSYWPLFCHKFGLSRAPNIIFCTSSYHVPRVVLGVGTNSPLLTPEFWHSRPELLKQLTPEMRDYVLDPGDTLKNSTIMVLGCDRQITANPFWKKDLFGDMQARVNYSSLHRVNNFNIPPIPSIAPSVGNNIVTLFRANIKNGLRREFRMLDRTIEKPLGKDSALPDDEKPKITLR